MQRSIAEIERQLLAEGHNIMKPGEDEDFSDYTERLNRYLDTVEDIKKSDLANYVSHRKVIIDLLEAAIKRNDDGAYAREDLIHRLIMPMGKESNDVLSESCNLWLVDERLAFHNYLASDKTLTSMPITGSDETHEPDILALNVFDIPMIVSEGRTLPLASFCVVELKKPMRNDFAAGEKKDPIEQALGYLERARRGVVQTVDGRIIPESDNIPGYCYIICDLTPSMQKRCKILGLDATSDNTGFFGYNKHYKAYIEVLSFDRLVNGAKERNKAFFTQLGLPTT